MNRQRGTEAHTAKSSTCYLEEDDNLVLVNFSTTICGVLIKDSFLWLKSNRSVLQMKLFAVNLLAERLDRPTFTAIDPRDIECK